MSRLLIPVLFFLASPVDAAWITIKNETKETLIVQEIVTVKGKAVAGKPVKLVPGETLREFQAAPVAKTIQIREPGKLANKLLSQSDVALKDKDLSFSIQSVNGKVKLVEPKVVAKK